MVYNDIITKQGLVQDVDFLVDTDSVTYIIEDKTRNFNLALSEITGLIIGCDGTWQWDDSNYTDLPIGTTSLQSSQVDYSFNDVFLSMEAVEVKDQHGNWKRLKPIDLYPDYNRESKTSITDYLKTPGAPQYYDKIGSSVFIYPPANYTQTDSLKTFYQRKASEYTISDTSKQAGFAPHLHRVLSLSVAYDWAVSKQHAKLNWLMQEKERYKKMIKDFYSN